ncbi:hypothetical protein BDV06DRAFT_167882 [Aspergillus oleicola]
MNTRNRFEDNSVFMRLNETPTNSEVRSQGNRRHVTHITCYPLPNLDTSYATDLRGSIDCCGLIDQSRNFGHIEPNETSKKIMPRLVASLSFSETPEIKARQVDSRGSAGRFQEAHLSPHLCHLNNSSREFSESAASCIMETFRHCSLGEPNKSAYP